MKACRRNRGFVPFILNLGARERILRLGPGIFTHGADLRYPWNRRLGDSRAGLDAPRKRKIFGLMGIQTPDHPVWSLVTVITR
jgi:hypothetical protein